MHLTENSCDVQETNCETVSWDRPNTGTESDEPTSSMSGTAPQLSVIHVLIRHGRSRKRLPIKGSHHSDNAPSQPSKGLLMTLQGKSNPQ